jgi:hypothetical protein
MLKLSANCQWSQFASSGKLVDRNYELSTSLGLIKKAANKSPLRRLERSAHELFPGRTVFIFNLYKVNFANNSA